MGLYASYSIIRRKNAHNVKKLICLKDTKTHLLLAGNHKEPNKSLYSHLSEDLMYISHNLKAYASGKWL